MTAVFLESLTGGKRRISTITSVQSPSNDTDTRLSKRVTCKVSITYEYYDPENFSCVDTFKMGDAKLCNYSHGGMCLELKRPLKPDLPVFVRMDTSGVIPGLEKKQGHHVEVIWCRQPNSKKTNNFRIGVRFYESPLASAKHNRRLHYHFLDRS